MSKKQKWLKQWQKKLLVLILSLGIIPSFLGSVFLVIWWEQRWGVEEVFWEFVFGGGVIVLGLGLWAWLVLWLRIKLKLEKEFDLALEIVISVCLGLLILSLVTALISSDLSGSILLWLIISQLNNNKNNRN